MCYKPNVAFFEALGAERGGATLRRVVDAVRLEGVPVLLDVKRGDIGTTAAAYAEACYDEDHGLRGDAATLSPLMGWDSVRPFVTGRIPSACSTTYSLVLVVIRVDRPDTTSFW